MFAGWCRPQQDDDYVNDEDDYADADNDEEAVEDAGPQPEIVSAPLTLNLKAGDVAVFPCVVDGVESE